MSETIFSIVSSSSSSAPSAARTGILRHPTREITLQTPAWIVPSTRCAVPHLTPDTTPTQVHAVAANIHDVFEHPRVSVLADFKASKVAQEKSEAKGNHEASLWHGFFNVPTSRWISLCVRDVTNPSTFDTQTGNEFITIQSAAGRKQLTCAQYMELANLVNPDVLFLMSDEVPGTSGLKRIQKSVERSSQLFKSCMKLKTTNAITFGVVQGGLNLELREKSLKDIVEAEVHGIAIGGLGLGETKTQRGDIIAHVLKHAPVEKLRAVQGIATPVEIIDSVLLGVDLFDTNYPYLMTENGCALTFPVEQNQSSDLSADYDGGFINLNDKKFRSDKGPLVEGCVCFTCKRHTRSYLHHLLNTQEMLVDTLLNIHNVTHIALFFEAIRAAIESGNIEQYSRFIKNVYES